MSKVRQSPSRRMTAAEFLPWAEEARARGEGRFELVDGVVTAMSAERAAHGETKLAVAVALLAGVRRAGRPCHVVPDGASVVVDDATTYEPDAIVYCGDEVEPTSLVVPRPLIVVEVSLPAPGTSTRATSSTTTSGYRAWSIT